MGDLDNPRESNSERVLLSGKRAKRVYAIGPADIAGSVTPFEIDDQSTTRGVPSPQPTAGARVVYLRFDDMGTSAAKGLYVVFNAANDADADSKLGAAGSRFWLPLGDPMVRSVDEGDEITRIDFLTDTAETGSNKVYGEYIIET